MIGIHHLKMTMKDDNVNSIVRRATEKADKKNCVEMMVLCSSILQYCFHMKQFQFSIAFALQWVKDVGFIGYDKN